jgi:hypothetical protein
MSCRLRAVVARLRYGAIVGVLVLPTLFIAIPAAIGAGESRDDAAHLTPANDSAHALAWTGTVGPNTPAESTSTHSYWFAADLGTAATAKATVWIEWDTPEDLNVAVLKHTDTTTTEVAGDDTDPGEDEVVSFDVENGGLYEVRVGGFANVSTAYRGYVWVRSTSGRSFNGPGNLVYPRPPLVATLNVPINIVFVGFDPSEVAAQKQTVLNQLPPAFRPVIRTQSDLGGGTVRREKATSDSVTMEPIEYHYTYNFIATPESYNRAFFAAAKAATSSGDYQLPFDRDYIERYNAANGAKRGLDGVVAPGTPIDFVDGFSLEDWVATHPPAGVSFDLAQPANGYTFFVVDSFRPSYAGQYYNKSRYHNFKVMNSLTVDPDSGAQSGFDWGRVWGGRYRFLMLDVGAAPNSWEGAVTLANTKIFRLEGNGDSSVFDPPIWHYGASDLQSFYDHLGEDIQYAIWMRFTRGYLYPPHPFDRFVIAANTWHDNAAYVPWPSKLEMLYKDQLVLDRYRELLPYSTVDGFSQFKYLSPGDPEQLAIDQGKQESVSGAPVPFTVATHPTMKLINQNRDKYAPLEAGAFTIPVVNAVFESLYTWSLPAIVGGVAEGEGGEPWGQLQNVNNRTKWPGATGTVTDSSGQTHSPTAPDERVEGVDNVARFGFTATTLHEAGHFFGLSHNHDAVAYDWHAGQPGEPTGYYNTIDWMYTTTATPMGYGWEYNRFEVMDKDNVWIGHATEWLDTAYDNLSDAYAALDSAGRTTVPSSVASAQKKAEAAIADAVAKLTGGRYLAAVSAARAAVNASNATLKVAVRQIR